MPLRRPLIVAFVAAAALICAACGAENPTKPAAATGSTSASTAASTTESLRGRIVWLGEALRRRFGIESDPDAMQSTVALEAASGELYPIVKDARGRGFHKDPRLHKLDYELAVRRFPGTQYVQVIRVYTFHEGRKYEFDYWCDICAIPMYELKDCECCQGPIRIRERLMGPAGPGEEREPGEAR